MGSDQKEDSGISRRDFASRLGAAAAGIAVGGDLFGGRLQAAPAVSRRILGANDRVVVASIGIRGQGNGVKRGFAKLDNVEIKTLCDIDANLAPERVNDPALKDVATLQARVRAGPSPCPGRQGHRRDHHRHAEPLARARDHPRPAWPASTSTSKSRRPTPCGKVGRWWKPPPATTRWCRSGR